MIFRKKIKLSDLSFSCDIHSHILPGVDDGFLNMKESIEMLQLYQKNGMKQLVLTPHIDPGTYPRNNEDFLNDRFKSFIEEIPANINMDLYLGAEYMCDEKLKADKPFLFIGKTGVLIEMSYFYQYPYLKETIFALVSAGFQPILAHPERYTYLARKLGAFKKFIDMGCLFQLNLLSLSGIYGKRSKIILHHLLDHDMYRYAGSDVHSLRQYKRISDINVSHKLAGKIEELMENNKELLT